MRVLYITQLPLVPPYSGGVVRVHNIAKQLARHCEVTMILGQSAAEIQSDPAFGPAFQNVRILSPVDHPAPPLSLWKMWQMKRRTAQWKDNPFLTVLRPRSEWEYLIDKAFVPGIDVVVIEQTWHIETMRYIRSRWPKVKCVLSAQNVKSDLFRRHAALEPDAAKADRLRSFATKMERIERRLSRYVDLVWACSERDKELLASMNPGLPITVVANGVDTGYFAYDARPGKMEKRRLIYGGTLSWPPSAEAVTYFHREVWPHVLRLQPGLRFTVIGRNPPPSLQTELSSDPSVEFLGEVPDARPHFLQSSISVCPIRSGGGTRLKILEAMAMGNPVVSTTIGAEGLNSVDGEHLRIADTPEAFAAAISDLLVHPEESENMRKRAREWVQASYGWNEIGEKAFLSLHKIVKNKG